MVMLLVGVNFDMRLGQPDLALEDMLAFMVAFGAFLYAMFGIFWSCWYLYKESVLAPVVRETAKVTSMVFTILIGSQLLNLVVISFGGEHYIQDFLKSFDNEFQVFLIVMLVLFTFWGLWEIMNLPTATLP